MHHTSAMSALIKGPAVRQMCLYTVIYTAISCHVVERAKRALVLTSPFGISSVRMTYGLNIWC